jgi:hypothetical protein
MSDPTNKIPESRPDLTAELMEITMTGFTVLKVIKEGDPVHLPQVSLSMPTDIATYIRDLINANK